NLCCGVYSHISFPGFPGQRLLSFYSPLDALKTREHTLPGCFLPYYSTTWAFFILIKFQKILSFSLLYPSDARKPPASETAAHRTGPWPGRYEPRSSGRQLPLPLLPETSVLPYPGFRLRETDLRSPED